MKRIPLLLSILLAAAGCGSDSKGDHSCDPLKADACGAGQVCEQVQGGKTACADPVEVQGVVFDLASGSATGGILGARVVPLDVNGAPVGTAATTGPGGAYKVRVPATRDANGKPVAGAVTLRADAETYATFPSGIRSAVPIDLAIAAAGNGVWTVHSSLTDVGLVKDPGAGTASLHGTVAGVSAVGALVVAEPTGVVGGVGRTGVADASGSYVIFNLPAGDWTVKAYAKGVNHAPATAAGLAANEDRALDLATRAVATVSISGNIQRTGREPAQPRRRHLGHPGGQVHLRRRHRPRRVAPGPGLRGARGPGHVLRGRRARRRVHRAGRLRERRLRARRLRHRRTAPVPVTVVDGVMTSAPGNFKITGALSLTATGISPATATKGSATVVGSLAPTFAWASYPSAAEYEVTVFDALGSPVWAPTRYPSSTTTVTYAGPALSRDLTYQVRVVAFDTGGSQISRTEDLKGVFVPRP